MWAVGSRLKICTLERRGQNDTLTLLAGVSGDEESPNPEGAVAPPRGAAACPPRTPSHGPAGSPTARPARPRVCTALVPRLLSRSRPPLQMAAVEYSPYRRGAVELRAHSPAQERTRNGQRGRDP
eukprot:scaffold106703_cov60-Phaeocystis_antarctica.AAC.1